MHVSRHTGRHGMALLFMAAVVVSFSVAHDAWCQTPANGVSSPAKAGEAAGGNEVGMTLSREAPPDYVAGQSVEIVVTLNITNAAQLLAVGLYETIPEGWVFEQFRGISGSPPALAPQPGTEGTLSFAWINTPEMPCSFAYSLHTSADSVGTKMISGRAEYRTSGAAQYSEPVVTELSGTDLTPPVLTLLGDNPMSLAQGTPYAEPGCTAIDSQEGDLTAKVQITGTVDANTPGSYSISYSAKDTAGNEATAVRQVQVGAKSGEGAAEGAKEDASKSGADKFASGNTAAATNSASGDPRRAWFITGQCRQYRSREPGTTRHPWRACNRQNERCLQTCLRFHGAKQTGTCARSGSTRNPIS